MHGITEKRWYDDVPIGVHQLQTVVGKLCKQAGFEGRYTNHSLRASAATRLYHAGIDEQLIVEKTGHRSKAVRVYKRTSEIQLEHISDVVQPKKAKVATASVASDTSNHDNGLLPPSKEICIVTGDVSIKVQLK